jgi:hypothetical protein
MKEIWEPIPGYEGRYDVSNFGRFRYYRVLKNKTVEVFSRTFNTKILPTGYSAVGLIKDGKCHTYKVHRIVALVFLGKRPFGFEVSHLDGNKKNNLISNLIYESHGDNIRRMANHGTILVGERNPNSKLTALDVKEIRRLLRGKKLTQKEIAGKFGVNRTCISKIFLGVGWKSV